MKFLGNLFHHNSQASFSSISGYDDVKNIINRVLSSEENFNLLLVGPPASSKTQFLMEIMKAREGKTVYFDATNTTNRILQVLEKEKPEIVLLDELDKLRNFAEKSLNFLESGRIKVDQKKCQMDFELKGCKVFATANEVNRLSKPLQSRFRKLFLPRYTEEQFLDVSEKVLPKISPSIARYIGVQVWKNGGDIRDCISIGKSVRKNDGPEEIALIISTISKYGREGSENR